MSKPYISRFLLDLRKSNSKAWMDEHRDRYHQARDYWLEEVQLYLNRLSEHDPSLATLKPQNCILRINNHVGFQPNKPLYKDFFGFDPYKGVNRVGFYLHFRPGEFFIAGGMWRPIRENLEKIRQAIDYDGERFQKMLDDPDFKSYFGGLEENDMLKTSPRDYPTDHPHIELLRHKSLTVMHSLEDKRVMSDDFVDELEQAFLIMRPFLDYLQQAVDFEA
ncbi:MAG: DUF2461 domain-containing protein [Bacteroidota bacterium]